MTDLVTLRAAGVAVVLDTSGDGLPRILHWGRDLPDAACEVLPLLSEGPVPPSAPDEPWPFTILPGPADGWLGTPGYAGHVAGTQATARWQVEHTVATERSLTVRARNGATSVSTRHTLDEHGVLAVALTLTRDADADSDLDVAALRALVPLPPQASEVLDLTGRWCRERSPQRRPLHDGTILRSSRRGRTGHDATLVLVAGSDGFGWRTGEVWAVHVAWSGNHEHLVERLPEGAGAHSAVLGGGELLEPGEVRLASGESYTTPEVLFTYGSEGLDSLSRRLHGRARAQTPRARGPRPLVINTWEAVYFDHDLDRLTALAESAAQIGVERFVLDDGWFGARRHDRAGLGDWVVSHQAWPQGLRVLADTVRALGMEFGLWFEPEMVNLDSDLVRAHPDWVLGPRAGLPRPWRHQQVLDLANPQASEYLLEAISAVVARVGVSFIKWDHNRDLLEAVRTDGTGADRPAVHAQTRAFYALLDRLRERHPDLEIESCSSGGARVDLGVLARTDRVWTSDCNDALERALIQRWTSLLLPAELMGTHIGPPTAHTTHRTVDLATRMLLALGGHAGLEWDITTCSEDEREQLAAWSALYRELRPLLHSGEIARADADDGTVLVTGTCAPDRSAAAYTLLRLATSPRARPGRVALPGLDPDRTYAVRVRTAASDPALVEIRDPRWWVRACDRELVVPGAALTDIGLPLPVLAPGHGFLLDVRARP